MQLRRHDVLAGAIAILDEYGLADLTMRRLASSLGVQPGALYWHFPNKQTLLAAITDEILADASAGPPAPAETWDERLPTLARRMRDALLSHRDGAEVASASYAARLASEAPQTALAAACIDGGLPADEAGMAARALFSYVLGQTMDEQSRMQMDSHGALTESASPLFESPTAADGFEYGLGLFIGGVRALPAVVDQRLS
ncbi:TetR family transcriptional regulator [Tomitella fengzijianii]|uniref:TetR family transcriptional regulator n=1 Tax=Tomitella fengzijianii TaxID=2597660 RepID=A0A516X444_9ACTN|nr:TetR family transcriptional regulator [Tomitella fengzijianii]QDQ97846.1 TetR family transcriptional regulator [Tomitella fengzijianii]